MFERFTKDAKAIVLAAIRMAAAEGGSGKVGPDELLLAVLATGGSGARVLAGFGVTEEVLRAGTTPASRTAGLTDEDIAALKAVGIDTDEVFRRIEQTFGAQALDDQGSAGRPRRRGRLGGVMNAEGRKVIELSLREAVALRHRAITSAHILLALLRNGVSEPFQSVLAEKGVTYDEARPRANQEISGAA
jgi:ATP-dependent Clp protease ATP-binding subunit ClpA